MILVLKVPVVTCSIGSGFALSTLATPLPLHRRFVPASFPHAEHDTVSHSAIDVDVSEVEFGVRRVRVCGVSFLHFSVSQRTTGL